MIGHPDPNPASPDPSLEPQPASPPQSGQDDAPGRPADAATAGGAPAEVGGRDGPDPTRYGDWEKNGRCIDF